MCEIFKETWARLPEVAAQAQDEIAVKLQVWPWGVWRRRQGMTGGCRSEVTLTCHALLQPQVMTVLDSGGRQTLPQEGKASQTAVYCMALAAGPSIVPDHPRDSAFSKRWVRWPVTRCSPVLLQHSHRGSSPSA